MSEQQKIEPGVPQPGPDLIDWMKRAAEAMRPQILAEQAAREARWTPGERERGFPDVRALRLLLTFADIAADQTAAEHTALKRSATMKAAAFIVKQLNAIRARWRELVAPMIEELVRRDECRTPPE